ncbi:hypothetical protein LUZ63_016377 [Rhynchospora breviuscula]|uniref:Uncharacterized protein n=1 Tax=Rhynchospora breviuscula TaxID=2022672 RepID=A0A9P9ZBP3_9POAL|nr:hypothetical protein LUZ63_016377 [Rhynchospora breviuscula]
MASLTQGAQNENLVMPRGKVGDGLKPDLSKPIKTAKKPLGKVGDRSKPERKPLGDLSNIRKPQFSTRFTKDVSTELKARENTTNLQRNNTLTKEQIKQCEEWAQEGIEHMHFTGNDSQQLERNHMDKRVREEVAMVMSSMHEWGNDIFDLVLPVKDEFGENGLKLEFEPEILPSPSDKRRVNEEKLDQLLAVPETFCEDLDLKLEFKIKEFAESD